VRAPGVRGEGAGRSLGRWPRSGERDVRLALELASHSTWAQVPAGERVERLLAAAGSLAAGGDSDGPVALGLGLTTDELALHRSGLEAGLTAAIREGAQRGGERRGPCLLRPHWSLLWAGLGELLLRELAAGRPVLLLPDGGAPALVDQLVKALDRADLPPGALAVLHDDGRTALRCAVDAGGAEELLVSCATEELDELRRWLRARSPQGDLPFGTGVCEPAAAPELVHHDLGVRTARVSAGEDVEEVARRLALAALGRGETLSGQLPGHVRRIECDERCFSAFTAALLGQLEEAPELRPPVPQREPRLARELDQIRELGLADGATLIHEEGRRGSPGTSRNTTIGPLVFTNVLPGMRIAGLTRPAPVLLLQRLAAGE